MSEVLERQTNKQEVKPPSLWNVIFINDDFTTFDFVMIVLIGIFNKSEEEAFVLTKKIHENGKAIVAQYSKDVAETKRDFALKYAKQEEHPLNIILEENL